MDAPVSTHSSVRPYPATRVYEPEVNHRSLREILAEMGECLSEDRPLPHREGDRSWYPVEML